MNSIFSELAQQFHLVFILGGLFFLLGLMAGKLLIRRDRAPYHTMAAVSMIVYMGYVVFNFAMTIHGIGEYDFFGRIKYVYVTLMVPVFCMVIYSVVKQCSPWKLLVVHEIPMVSMGIIYVVTRNPNVLTVSNALMLIYAISWFTFLIVSIRRFRRRVESSYTDVESHNFKWIIWFFVAFIGFFILFYLAVMVQIPNFLSITYLYSVFLWVLIYRGVSTQVPIDVEMVEESIRGEEHPEEVVVPEEEALGFADKLHKCMVDGAYLNPDLTIRMLAKKVGTNTSYLSHFLNEECGKNFSTYVNDFRLDHAERLLLENSDFTLDEVAARSGFSSMSSFHRLFKFRNDCSPRAFVQKKKQEQK